MGLIFNRENVCWESLVLRWKGSSWEKGLSRGRVLMEGRSSWMKDPFEERALKEKSSSWRNVLIGKSPHGEGSL